MNYEKENKKKSRSKIKKLLEQLPVSVLKEKSSSIQSRLYSLNGYKNSSFIMCYLSTGREVSTFEVIETALSENKKVAVPLILESQNIMLPCEISNLKDLEPGPWGILQPIKEKIKNIPLKIVDLIIVPGIAFDKNGNRIGRGKGFYDRFLKSVPPSIPKIALAFSCQIAEKIPTTRNDIAMDKIITEDGVINCK